MAALVAPTSVALSLKAVNAFSARSLQANGRKPAKSGIATRRVVSMAAKSGFDVKETLSSVNVGDITSKAKDLVKSFDTSKVAADLSAKWEETENKPAVLAAVGVFLAGTFISSKVLDTVNHVPLAGGFFELIGLAYSAYFTYTYLLFADKREALIEDVKGKAKEVFDSIGK
eukprot:jgi/Mesvir1/15367/Mv06565-RA.1